MKRKADKQETKSIEPTTPNMSEFDFEQWARQVRPQLLASLQRRGK